MVSRKIFRAIQTSLRAMRGLTSSSNQEAYVKEGWLGPGKKDSAIQRLAPKEDSLHVNLHKRHEYELWYFDAQLDTGHTLIVFFYAANPNPLMLGKPGIEVTLISHDGSKKNLFFPYPKSALSTSQDTIDVKISTNYFKIKDWRNGLPLYELCINEKDFSCHIFYDSEVEPWKPGRGFTRFGPLDYFAWIIPVARASITGTVTDQGEKFSVRGYGYHDHNWLNLSFLRDIDYWFWGRFYFQDKTFCVAVIQCSETAGKHLIKVLMKANGKEVVLSTGEFDFFIDEFENSQYLNIKYPSRININDSNEVNLQIKNEKILESEYMLHGIHQPARFIANFVVQTKPVYFRISADCTLNSDVSGDINFERGSGLQELVIFRPSYEP